MHFSQKPSILLSLGVLGALGVYRAAVGAPPAGAERYHQQIRAARDAQPLWVGSWMGKDLEVRAGAVALLHPNVMMCRQFTTLQTGRVVTLMIVQGEDARDMLGHSPPVCYVAHGWTSARE